MESCINDRRYFRRMRVTLTGRIYGEGLHVLRCSSRRSELKQRAK
jgi:hypothetical protein